MPYRTFAAEPGMLVEVYFPKKAAYQGALFAALVKGLDQQAVKKYLTRHMSRVRHLVRPKLSVPLAKRVGSYRQVFHGYSMYEVDGVFRGQVTSYEERTQVLRLLFKPEYHAHLKDIDDEALPQVYEYIRRFRQIPISITDNPIEHFKTFERIKTLSKQEKQALQAVLEWSEDIHLFVFGYLLGRFTEIGGLKEEEIWVTSYRSAVVNVISRRRRGRQGGNARRE